MYRVGVLVVVRICEEESRLWSWVNASYVMDSEEEKLSRGDEGEDTHRFLKRTKRSGIMACFVLLDVPSSIVFPLRSSLKPFVSLYRRCIVLFGLDWEM
jgi:hypothetical protein